MRVFICQLYIVEKSFESFLHFAAKKKKAYYDMKYRYHPNRNIKQLDILFFNKKFITSEKSGRAWFKRLIKS